MKYLAGTILLFISLIANVGGTTVDIDASGIWSIADTETTKRWVVIHQTEKVNESEIYHIEVIGRKKGDPAWKVKRIVKHMAITKEALEKSIVAPLTKGSVYPEPFDNAFGKWKRLNQGKGGPICAQTVIECITQK